MSKILVVDDDASMRKVICAILRRNSFEALQAEDGAAALNIINMNNGLIDLVISDLVMPNMDGNELKRQLRMMWKTIPFLMITANNDYKEKQSNFLFNIDDYMAKPVDAQDMILRIKDLIRRAHIACERKITFGDIILEYDTLAVSRTNTSIKLTREEFHILFILLSYPNKIFTQLQIQEEVWDIKSDIDDSILDVYINLLRDKFRNWTEFDIVTVRGLGYKAATKEYI